MYGRKLLFLMLLILIFVSSCASPLYRDVFSEDALQRAIDDEIISEPESRRVEEGRRNLIEVQKGDIIDTRDRLSIGFDISQVRNLYFERDEVRLLELYVSLNQRVEEGEVLAIAEFDTRELEAEVEILQLGIESMEQALEREREGHVELLAEMRRLRDFSDDIYEWDTQNYRMERQELIFQQLVREYEFGLERYREDLEKLYGLLEGEKILAPFDGIIVSIRDVRSGTIIRNFDTMFGIINTESFQFAVTENIGVMRYGDQFLATLPSYGFEFEMEVVSDPIATGTREVSYRFVLQPVDREGFWRAVYDFGVEASALRNLRVDGFPIRHEIKNVLTIPVAALNDHDEDVYVLLYEDGEIKMRFVEVGFRDDVNVQILSGLEEGQLIVR